MITGGPTPGPREVLGELFARIGQGRWSELGELYADDVVVVEMFAPDGPRRSDGRVAVERFFGFLASTATELQVEGLSIWATDDPELGVAQFRFTGVGADGTFALPGLFLSRVRDGVIVTSQDYTGPRQVR